MLSKSLKIIHIDRNMSEFWWILCKSIILRVGHLLVLLYDFVFQFTDMDNIKNWLLIIKFLIMKPARCTNFSNLFLEWNSTYFGQFLCPSSGIFHCTQGSGICHTGLRTACEQDSVPSWSCSQAVNKPLWHIHLLHVQWKTPDDGQRNCSKHVEFHYKNKLEKLVHLVYLLHGAESFLRS
jgi:hypothetical protein